jgi:putative transposase
MDSNIVCQRNKYHSFIIWLYNQKKESLLPEKFRNQIPHSTASTWRNINFDDYIGNEFAKLNEEALNYLEIFEKHQKLKTLILTFTKVWISIHKYVQPNIKRELLINSIQQLATILKTNLACKIFNMSRASYHAQLAQLKYKCDNSSLSLCFKKNPLQLSPYEVQTLKNAFSNDHFKCWPGISIYYLLLRENKLNISKSTFYKYVNILNLQRKWKKQKENYLGLITKKPNEYLHVDTTYWKLDDGKKVGIVFVSDNYSKAILGWNIGLGNSSENVLNALKMAISTIHQYHPDHPCSIQIMADGGAENHTLPISQLLQADSNPVLSKVIAKKDVCFSNSSIEAVNKIMKRYLRIYKPGTLEKVNFILPTIINNYMFERPHGSLNGSTPFEVYTNQKLTMNFSKHIKKAYYTRIAQNKNMNCMICS